MPNSCNINRTWNTHEIYKHYVQVSLDDWRVAKKYQALLWHKTWQNLTAIDVFGNIRLIQACIYHGYYKIFQRAKDNGRSSPAIVGFGFAIMWWCLKMFGNWIFADGPFSSKYTFSNERLLLL